MLHFDVLRLISLNLEPEKLIGVNKELSLLYDDIWYHDKLKILTEKTLYTTTNYKDLYDKFMLQGEILVYDSFLDFVKYNFCKLPIEGIKVCTFNDNSTMVLTFNGELFIDNFLIDTKVIDVCECNYIKQREWYVYDDKWIKLDLNENFVKVKYDGVSNKSVVMTNSKLYYYDGDIYEVNVDNITNIFIEHVVYVRNKNGNTFFSGDLSHKFIKSSGTIKLESNDILYENNNPITFVPDLRVYDFTTAKINFNGYITKMFTLFRDLIIMNKHNIYTSSMNIYDEFSEFKMLLSDVKNIFSDQSIYVII
jgi:hypothetical protein